MKLRNHQFSTQPKIFKENGCVRRSDKAKPILNRPNPPSKEAIEKAKFVDKTYRWDGGIRSGNKRAA